MMKDRAEFEHARQQAIDILQNMESENVIRSVLFVLGDYGVTESENKKEAAERANYITAIIYYAVNAETMDDLQSIYSYTKAVIEVTAKMKAEKGGEV